MAHTRTGGEQAMVTKEEIYARCPQKVLVYYEAQLMCVSCMDLLERD